MNEAEEINGYMERLSDIFNNTVLQVIFWGVTILFIVLTISQGVKFAMAKTPEEKASCKQKFIQLAIGFACVFGASTLVTILGNYFSSVLG